MTFCCRLAELNIGPPRYSKMAVLHILLAIFFVTISSSITEVDSLPPTEIYWNRTNTIFQTSNDDHIIQLNMGQSIRFVCPYYPEGSGNEMEHYLIYKVPKQHYDQCSLPNVEWHELSNYGIMMVNNCSAPTTSNNYQFPIVNFSPLPPSQGGFVFEEGKSYYYTTISTGSVSGLYNTEPNHSACKRFHMKTQLRICCNQSNNESTMSPDPNWTIQQDRRTLSLPTNPSTRTLSTFVSQVTDKPSSTIKRIIVTTVKRGIEGSTEPRTGAASHTTASLLTLCICSIVSMVLFSR